MTLKREGPVFLSQAADLYRIILLNNLLSTASPIFSQWSQLWNSISYFRPGSLYWSPIFFLSEPMVAKLWILCLYQLTLVFLTCSSGCWKVPSVTEMSTLCYKVLRSLFNWQYLEANWQTSCDRDVTNVRLYSSSSKKSENKIQIKHHQRICSLISYQ